MTPTPPTLLVLVSLSPAFSTVISLSEGFPVAQRGKRLPAVQETQGSIPGSGRSPGEGNGYPLQYSSLENPTDRGAWWATVHGVPESDVTKPHTHTTLLLCMKGKERSSGNWHSRAQQMTPG